MKSEDIKTLDDLIKRVGKPVADRIFMEYFMELVAKSNLLDEIRKIVENGGTLDEIEEIL